MTSGLADLDAFEEFLLFKPPSPRTGDLILRQWLALFKPEAGLSGHDTLA